MARPAPRTARPGLDRVRVVMTAREIARRHGMEAVTISGVARALDVTAMALYRHVNDIDEMIELVIDAINAEISLPDPGVGEDRLMHFVSTLRSIHAHYGQYRGLAEVLLARGPVATSGSVRIADWFLRNYLAIGPQGPQAMLALAAFREFFLVSLIQRRPQPEARHRHNISGADRLDNVDDVTNEDRFNFAIEVFVQWVQNGTNTPP